MRRVLTSAALLAHWSLALAAPKGAPAVPPTLNQTARTSGFPADFSWGVASAAYQVEGAWNVDGRAPSIWDTFAHTPGTIKDNSTGDVAIDSYHRYKEDVDLAASLGVGYYRFSISWPRILPTGDLPVNQKGIDYYNALIDYCLSKNITPFITLYHWDMPQALEDSFKGWLDRKVVGKFVTFAEVAFTSFGDRVTHFLTFNEPVTFLNLGYAEGVHAPGRCSNRTRCAEGNSSTEPYLAGHHVLLAHAYAAKKYKELLQSNPKLKKGGLGMALNSDWGEPLTDSPADKAAAEKVVLFQMGWFADPVYKGQYPEEMKEILGDRLPAFSKEESELLKGSLDFYGVNYYTSRYISADIVGEQLPPSAISSATLKDLNVGSTIIDSTGARMGDFAASKWLVIVPWGIRKLLAWVSARYNHPDIYVTENGISGPGNVTQADGTDDGYRVRFYDAHIANLAAAMREGVKLKGYFPWCLADNFEWANGYTERFGLVFIDRADGSLTRHKKKSAEWLEAFIAPEHRVSNRTSAAAAKPANKGLRGGGWL